VNNENASSFPPGQADGGKVVDRPRPTNIGNIQ